MAHVNKISFADLKITYSIKIFRALDVFGTALAVLLCDMLHGLVSTCFCQTVESVSVCTAFFWAMQCQTNGCVTTLSSTIKDK
jgi:hypothetical protein